jgi:hypothetical protein
VSHVVSITWLCICHLEITTKLSVLHSVGKENRNFPSDEARSPAWKRRPLELKAEVMRRGEDSGLSQQTLAGTFLSFMRLGVIYYSWRKAAPSHLPLVQYVAHSCFHNPSQNAVILRQFLWKIEARHWTKRINIMCSSHVKCYDLPINYLFWMW